MVHLIQLKMPPPVADHGDADKQHTKYARDGWGFCLQDKDNVRVVVGLALAPEVKLSALGVDFAGSATHQARRADQRVQDPARPPSPRSTPCRARSRLIRGGNCLIVPHTHQPHLSSASRMPSCVGRGRRARRCTQPGTWLNGRPMGPG